LSGELDQRSDPVGSALTERFQRALSFAALRHNDQHRAGRRIPYISHLLATTALVLDAGGDEDQAIAGLLHDAIEDGKATYAEIGDRFGFTVADLVLACTEPQQDEDLSWRQRKQAYINILRNHDEAQALVACADKLQNARSVLFDFRLLGARLWKRLSPDVELLWYFRALADLYREKRLPLSAELDRTVRELQLAVDANGRLIDE
jgi:(p)ppGpp synthase/HD superfamily hydrolase